MRITLNELKSLVRQTLREENQKKIEVDHNVLYNIQQDLATIMNDMELEKVPKSIIRNTGNINARLKKLL